MSLSETDKLYEAILEDCILLLDKLEKDTSYEHLPKKCYCLENMEFIVESIKKDDDELTKANNCLKWMKAILHNKNRKCINGHSFCVDNINKYLYSGL